MLERALIKSLESSHKEALESAKEGAELGRDLRGSFELTKTLTRDDLKKLERLEKLTRKIRNKAGGSDDDVILEKPPENLDSALTRLADLSADLLEGLEKTSRHVVSTDVIDRANEALELIKHVRRFGR